MKREYVYQDYRAFVADALGPSELTDDARSSRQDKSDWSGAESWDIAAKMAMQGDIEGARKIQPRAMTAVNAFMKVTAPQLDPVFTLDGGRWIDIARYVKGEPECWGDMIESAPMPRLGLAVVINVSASGAISAGRLDAIGAEIAAALISLKAIGNNTTLWIADTAGRDDTPYICAVPINAGSGPIDMAVLSAVIRPWFLRRIFFSWMETRPADFRRAYHVPGGYGRARNITQEEAKRLTGMERALIFNMGSLRPDDVRQTVINTLTKGGR